ncbi:MAG TPA: hypothetical protein DIT90_06630 [Dehalococcoidia bacterium]|nr:hypothetical protein [Dehalococcoidia bacterium]
MLFDRLGVRPYARFSTIVSFGLIIGATIGAATDNIALWVVLGSTAGIVAGAFITPRLGPNLPTNIRPFGWVFFSRELFSRQRPFAS